MIKRIITFISTIIILVLCCTTVLAGGVDIFSKDTDSTDPFLVTITQPVDDDTMVSSTCDLKGITDYENVKVELLKYNREKGTYEYYKNTDGETSWVIKTSGYFWKQLELKKGLNRFRLVAYKLSNKSKIQITDFSVKVFDESYIKSLNTDSMFKNVIK
ncbi:MAG TPA: hypothetical protein VHT34_07670 [Clostridia bacterium]|nr:hypothetical protein [Clostridia bacterium]